VPGFAEKDFYLDDFGNHTLVLAVDRDSVRAEGSRRRLAAVVRDLVANEARIVVVLGSAPEDAAPRSRAGTSRDHALRWRRWLGLPRTRPKRSRRVPPAGARGDAVLWSRVEDDEPMRALWRVLRVRSLCLVVTGEPAIGPACRIARDLRVHKLVLIDRRGGLRRRGSDEVLSYLDGADLDAILGGGDEALGAFGSRRSLLQHVDGVLDRVSSVNVCKIDGLAHELFTYEGSGTFFSRDDHCQVAPLGIDDFDEVERLIARGQKEGLLRPRSADEIGEILLDGFGVWVGVGHLAGVGALRTWQDEDGEGAGEIVGLYTFTRFKGEGIGSRLVKRLLQEASSRGLGKVFALTTSERAARFFLREGFREVSHEALPATKWEGYDAGRRARVRVFRRKVRRRARSFSAGAKPARRPRSG